MNEGIKAYPKPLRSDQCLVRHLARVTFELETPMHVGAGREWRESDAGIVFDPNGLPSIPGSSIAGVLRAAYAENGGSNEDTHLIFGFQGEERRRGDATTRGVGQGSRLTVSWARIHDSSNKPVCTLLPDIPPDDEVLQNSLEPTLRDHVNINARGVAAERGKFDELVICTGHRFTFEMEFCGRHGEKKHADDTAWKKLLELLDDPLVRFGGKTRRGFGRFHVERYCQRSLVLTESADFEIYRDHDVNLGEEPRWSEWKKPSESQLIGDYKLRVRNLQPRFFWMFGGGSDPDADMAPVRDARIRWDKSKRGQVEGNLFYIPGSSVKGALRHRALFHAYAMCGHFADEPKPDEQVRAKKAVDELFGYPKTRNAAGETVEEGKRGRIFIDDLFLPEHKIEPNKDGFLPEPHLQHHVSIDRFTGGARDGLLFTEKPLFAGTPIQLRIVIDKRGLAEAPRQRFDLACKALDLTLQDLEASRLALGGGVGRGLGFFQKPNSEQPDATAQSQTAA